MLVAVNDRTGREVVACPGPFTLDEAYVVRSKFNPHRYVRIVLRYFEEESA
jgi:hypothetical protein